MENELVCSSCDRPKNKLFPVKSTLVSGMTLYMCKTCLDKGYEPRWAIIMAGRTLGVQPIRRFIINHLYEGEKISASEVIN